MSRGVMLVALLCFLKLRYCEVIVVCMCLRFSWHPSQVLCLALR